MLAPDLQEILKTVCQVYGVVEKDLFNTQRGKSNEPRSVAIYLCRILRNDTLMELGKEIGMTGYSPAGCAVERVKKKFSTNDKKLKKKIEEIKQLLGS